MGTKKQMRPIGPEHAFIAKAAARHMTGAIVLRSADHRALGTDLQAHGYGNVRALGDDGSSHFCINDVGRLWLAGL